MTAPLFSDETLLAMRELHRGMLTSRARVDAPKASAGMAGQGGANVGGRAWRTVTDPTTGAPATAVPCRVSPLVPAADSAQADETVNITRWAVAFDLEGPPVSEGDRLTVTGEDALGITWSRTVLVIGRQTPRTYSAMRIYICQDVGPGMAGAAT